LADGAAEAKPALAAAMQDPRQAVRLGVCVALAQSRDPAFSDLAERAMDDVDPKVGYWARQAVMNAASGPAGAALFELMMATMRNPDIPEGVFEHKHIRPRVRAILDRIPADWWKTAVARAAVPTLIGRLRERSYAARVGVLEGLGRIGDPSARDAILEFLSRSDLGGNEFGLAGGFAAAKEALDAVAPGWRMSEEGRRRIAVWIARLVDDDPEARCDSGPGLYGLDPDWLTSEEARQAVPLLRKKLGYRDEQIRRNAAFYLKEMGAALTDGEEPAPRPYSETASEALPPKEAGASAGGEAFKTTAGEAWTGFAADLSLADLTGAALPPQICLYVKSISMAAALAGSRPAAVSALLASPPEVVAFKDGTAAIRFQVRAGRDLKALVDALFSGVEYPEPVVVTNGALVDCPAADRSALIGTFGAREGLGFGKVTMW
jgi:hypothetical protein